MENAVILNCDVFLKVLSCATTIIWLHVVQAESLRSSSLRADLSWGFLHECFIEARLPGEINDLGQKREREEAKQRGWFEQSPWLSLIPPGALEHNCFWESVPSAQGKEVGFPIPASVIVCELVSCALGSAFMGEIAPTVEKCSS